MQHAFDHFVRFVWEEQQISCALGKIHSRMKTEHLKQQRNAGKITAAGEENYCLGDPEIQGQLCLTNQGMFHHFNNCALTTKRALCHRRAREEEIKYYTKKNWFSPSWKGGVMRWTSTSDVFGEEMGGCVGKTRFRDYWWGIWSKYSTNLSLHFYINKWKCFWVNITDKDQRVKDSH